MSGFKCAVDDQKRATELALLRCQGTAGENPQIRGFWGATLSFFLAFLGWFALAPLSVEVATSMGECENQRFPPEEYPTRVAYLQYKNISTKKPYCRHGLVWSNGSPIDCAYPPVNSSETDMIRYQPEVLAKCVCTIQTECHTTIANAAVASSASSIVVRVALGTLLERYGPVNVQSSLLTFGAIWVAMSGAVRKPWHFVSIRFFIGVTGGTFVTTQFWCSLMFAPNVVGTANATAAGWGNLGGGVAQIVMVSLLFEPLVSSGFDADKAWRLAMLVPALLLFLCAGLLKLLCWDTPTAARFSVAVTGKRKEPSFWDYVEVLKDVRVLVMLFQYSACFGTEIVMNNQLATHFRTYFQMPSADASALAGAFGLMNLFARSLGGISSDLLFKRFGFCGRIWAQFFCLVFEAISLFCFGLVDNSQPWYVALAVLICFSLFVQMAEGTSFAIVPFMNPQQLAIVSALVGAGGNLGATIASFLFYRSATVDPLMPFQLHAGYVLFWSFLTPVFYWRELGGMFHGAKPEDFACIESLISNGNFTKRRELSACCRGEGKVELHAMRRVNRWKATDDKEELVVVKKLPAARVNVNKGKPASEHALHQRVIARDAEDPLAEIGVFSFLRRCDNIPQYILEMLSAFQVENEVWLVLEHADGGDLFGVISSKRPGAQMLLLWTWQLLQAVRFLHNQGICHRDISLENVLLSGGDVRLMDFGQAVTSNESGELLRYFVPAGKPYYRPPETYIPNTRAIEVIAPKNSGLGQVALAATPAQDFLCHVRLLESARPGQLVAAEPWGYTAPPVDVFACAVSMLIMFFASPPWRQARPTDNYFQWVQSNGVMALAKSWQKALPAAAGDLLGQMLSASPEQRPGIDECLAHSCFASLRSAPIAVRDESEAFPSAPRLAGDCYKEPEWVCRSVEELLEAQAEPPILGDPYREIADFSCDPYQTPAEELASLLSDAPPPLPLVREDRIDEAWQAARRPPSGRPSSVKEGSAVWFLLLFRLTIPLAQPHASNGEMRFPWLLLAAADASVETLEWRRALARCAAEVCEENHVEENATLAARCGGIPVPSLYGGAGRTTLFGRTLWCAAKLGTGLILDLYAGFGDTTALLADGLQHAPSAPSAPSARAVLSFEQRRERLDFVASRLKDLPVHLAGIEAPRVLSCAQCAVLVAGSTGARAGGGALLEAVCGEIQDLGLLVLDPDVEMHPQEFARDWRTLEKKMPEMVAIYNTNLPGGAGWVLNRLLALQYEVIASGANDGGANEPDELLQLRTWSLVLRKDARPPLQGASSPPQASGFPETVQMSGTQAKEWIEERLQTGWEWGNTTFRAVRGGAVLRVHQSVGAIVPVEVQRPTDELLVPPSPETNGARCFADADPEAPSLRVPCFLSCKGPGFKETWGDFRRKVLENAKQGLPLDEELLVEAVGMNRGIVESDEILIRGRSRFMARLRHEYTHDEHLEGFCLYGVTAAAFVKGRHMLSMEPQHFEVHGKKYFAPSVGLAEMDTAYTMVTDSNSKGGIEFSFLENSGWAVALEDIIVNLEDQCHGSRNNLPPYKASACLVFA
ncbi:unnamed protein product [Effrenium voratum]|nr:unnamed protein product [Effrenium voratum]